MKAVSLFLWVFSVSLLNSLSQANRVVGTIATESDSLCPSGSWTRWYRRDHPSGKCDCQTVKKIRAENPGEVCNNPIRVEAREVGNHQTINVYNDSHIDAGLGSHISCSSSKLSTTCRDYDVRFCCAPECFGGTNSYFYYGKRSVTKDGIPCLYWDSVIHNTARPNDGKYHNHCRNPERFYGRSNLWCFSARTFQRSDCGIPTCPTTAQVIWSSNDPENLKMYFHMRSVDYSKWPVGNNAKSSSFVIHANLARSPKVGALAVDNEGKQLYFGAHRQKYLGTVDMNWLTDHEIKYYNYYDDGRIFRMNNPERIDEDENNEMHNVNAMSFDPISRKHYWASQGSVKEASTTYRYQIFHNETPNEIKAMTLNPNVSLYIATSVNKTTGAAPTEQNTKLLKIDLNSTDHEVLFSYPEVHNVQGMTFDNKTTMLYWTDVLPGNISRVMCSGPDGSNVTEVFRSSVKAFFQKIAVHGTTIYVTDAMEKNTFFQGKPQSYVIWVFILRVGLRGQVLHYYTHSITEMARDIVIYGNEDPPHVPHTDTHNTDTDDTDIYNWDLPKVKDDHSKTNYFDYSDYSNNNNNNVYTDHSSSSSTSYVIGSVIGSIFSITLVVVSILRCRRRCRDSEHRQPDMEVLII